MTTPTDTAQAVPGTFDAQPPAPQAGSAPLPQLANQQATTVQIPEGGYASRFLRIPLPAFALAGLPEPWIEIRNPGMMAQATLEEIGSGMTAVTTGSNGEPADVTGVDAVLQQFLRLTRSWCMWDATSDADTPPLLPPPTDVAVLRRAPSGVLIAVMKHFQELQNPQ